MSISVTALTAEQLFAYLAAFQEYETLAAAIAQGGFHIIEDGTLASTALVVSGGAGIASTSATGTALQLAELGGLTASGTQVGTAAISLAGTGTGYTAVGLTYLELGTAAAACAPLLGVSIGANLYQSNPALWTKLSQKLLPFCYPGTTKVPAWIDIVRETGAYKLLVKMGLIDALEDFFAEEGIGAPASIGVAHTPTGNFPVMGSIETELYTYEVDLGTDVVWVPASANGHNWAPTSKTTPIRILRKRKSDGYTTTRTGGVSAETLDGMTAYYGQGPLIVNDGPATPSTLPSNRFWYSQYGEIAWGEGFPEGTSEWTGTTPEVLPWVQPIIIVPEPLGPEYQPIETPVTPISPQIVPQLPPPTTPLPLPPHVEPVEPVEPVQPTEPVTPPEEWPEEEPWPTVIPFPWTDPDPDPEDPWPQYIPWPLPEVPPSEWPTVPYGWPTEIPVPQPWPRSPEDWPEEFPWPETPPSDWPEEVPWPGSPEDWPEEVPWPVPWPQGWPEGEPWPVRWPEEIPYPWEFPIPAPSPSPEEEPEPIIDPSSEEVEPFIEPVPIPWEYPTTPGPEEEPSQPQPIPEPPSPPYTPAPPAPGEQSPEPFDEPIIPLPYSGTTGLITVYNPTQTELLNFANWLWVTWEDATIEKIWNNPFDGIITLFELYCDPTVEGRKTIRSGFLDSNVESNYISRYTSINCGSVGVPEFYGNYLDYSPYSKAHIYLPFIGVVELNVDDIVGHAVNVLYHIDEYNGSCIAQITVAKVTEVNGESISYSNTFYQFSGNCAVELPIAGGSQAAIKAGMLQAAAYGLGSVIGGVISGGSSGGLAGALAGGAAGLAYGAAQAVGSVVSAKSSVQHSGSFGASYGAMGIKTPFITITRPKQIQVINYEDLYGFPAHKSVVIGQCTGFLRCREVHIHSSTASAEESALIEQLLKEGIIIGDLE